MRKIVISVTYQAKGSQERSKVAGRKSGKGKKRAREAETIGNTFVNNRTQNNAGLLLTRDITSTIAMLLVRECEQMFA